MIKRHLTPPSIATLTLLAGISALNMSIFLPSLSNMAAHFNTSYGVMQLAVSLYLGATMLAQLVIGPLSDRFGRRPVLLWGVGGFILASLGCALAPNATIFLICRIAQAAISSAMVLSRAIVRDLYPTEQAASVLGYVIMGMSIAPMIGPLIGGALDQALGWQSIFWFLILVGAGTWLIIWSRVAETAPALKNPSGETGNALPLLLRSQRFWAYMLTATLSAGAYFALLGGASHVASTVFSLSPAEAGFALGAPAVGYMLGNGISGRFSPRIGIDPMIFWGAALTAIFMGASWAMTLAGWQNPLIFFGFCSALGLGNGLVMPNTMAGMLSVRPELAGSASGIGGAVQVGGGALLATLAGFLLEGGASTLPLQAIMAICSLAALGTALWASARNRALASAR